MWTEPSKTSQNQFFLPFSYTMLSDIALGKISDILYVTLNILSL